MIRKLLIWLGLAPSKRDMEMRELFKNSYDGVEVVGRGTLKVDPDEVRRSPQFQEARRKAKAIVDKHRARHDKDGTD